MFVVLEYFKDIEIFNLLDGSLYFLLDTCNVDRLVCMMIDIMCSTYQGDINIITLQCSLLVGWWRCRVVLKYIMIMLWSKLIPFNQTNWPSIWINNKNICIYCKKHTLPIAVHPGSDTRLPKAEKHSHCFAVLS